MKSLYDNPILNNPEIFNEEIINHIRKEGFEYTKNDSYCYREIIIKEDYTWEEKCYKKCISVENYTINVYIFSIGIGIDIDFSCGGNSFIHYWLFDKYSFEEAYDNIVDTINNYK